MHGWELEARNEKEKKMFIIYLTLFDSKNVVINFLDYLNSSHGKIKLPWIGFEKKMMKSNPFISLSNVTRTLFFQQKFIAEDLSQLFTSLLQDFLVSTVAIIVIE